MIAGISKLRRRAGELVRRIEHGLVVTVILDGRPAAQLVSIKPNRWRRAIDIRPPFAGADDVE